MSFVPLIATPPQPPSHASRELGRRLTETIERYEQEHPGTRPDDVRRALALAAASRGTEKEKVLIMIAAAMVLFTALVFFFLR